MRSWLSSSPSYDSKRPASLGDILEAGRLIQRYTEGITFRDFLEDLEKQDAVVRRIEIIGEAAKKLPLTFREEHPAVPWRDISGTRDILVHEYFRVDPNLAWDMVRKDIPELIREVERILEEASD